MVHLDYSRPLHDEYGHHPRCSRRRGHRQPGCQPHRDRSPFGPDVGGRPAHQPGGFAGGLASPGRCATCAITGIGSGDHRSERPRGHHCTPGFLAAADSSRSGTALLVCTRWARGSLPCASRCGSSVLCLYRPSHLAFLDRDVLRHTVIAAPPTPARPGISAPFFTAASAAAAAAAAAAVSHDPIEACRLK